MKKRIRLFADYYRTVMIFTGLISCITWGIGLFYFLLVKAVTQLCIALYQRQYSPAQRYYYANLGISEVRLHLTVFLVDLSLLWIPFSILKLL